MPFFIASINALFLFMAILYFYRTLRFYMQERRAFYLSYLLGIYPLFFRYIHLLMTETFAIFLVCGFLFHFCKLYQDNKDFRIHLFVASGYLAYLALTKIFFGSFISSRVFTNIRLLSKFCESIFVFFFA